MMVADRHVSLFGLRHVCAICRQQVNSSKSMVALVGNASSSAFKAGFINPFTPNGANAQRRRYSADIGPWQLCRFRGPDCDLYDRNSRPGCAVHPECLQLYMRLCTADDVLDRLWQACVWARAPWTGARVPENELRLLPQPVWHFADAFLACAERCGLPGLDTLPQLVIECIMESLPREHYFWRCVAALDMASRLSTAPAHPLRIVQLSRLLSWERGETPRVSSEEELSGDIPQFVRLTIDVDGICKVERLTKWPHFHRDRSDAKAFVVERADDLGVSLAFFKNGLLKLSVLEDIGEFRFAVWDTPTPPDLAQCIIKPERPLSMLRYHTIDLAAATGLTFFIMGRRILAIHAHSRAQPSARATYETLEEVLNLNKYCTWHYVPLPQGDTVLSCGPLVNRNTPPGAPARWSRPCFLIRMRLSGETVVGQYAVDDDGSDNDDRDMLANSAYLVNRPELPPTTLVYNTEPGWPKASISVVTMYNGQGRLSGVFEKPWHSPPPSMYPSWHRYSHASLEHVCRVQVYYCSAIGGLCLGMLLQYENGGQRAVGQCRVHESLSRVFNRPSFMAYCNIPDSEGGVDILFDELPPPDDEFPDSWCYYAMAGTVECWADADTATISVRGGRPLSREELSKG